MKIWTDEYNFVEIDHTSDPQKLTEEIANRSRSMDWWGMFGFLPDPDPVLLKLGMGLDVYRELLTDAHVWSCYDSRKSGALSCKWEVRKKASTSARALDLVSCVFDDLDVYQVISDMLDAPFYGMAPVEVLWAYGGGKWLPSKLEGKPSEWFVFSDANELRLLSANAMLEGEEIPDKKFLLPRHHATYLNPYGERVLSRCFWPVAFKKGGFKFWAIFTEKFGMPWMVGKVPRGTSDTDRNKLLGRLTAMVQDAVAVINDDESIEALEFKSGTASSDIYERLTSACNREVSKAILGQTLSTELDKGGSLAATKAHLGVRADIVDKDKRMVAAAMNQLCGWITELNVPGSEPPEFAWCKEDGVQVGRAKRDTELNDQGVRFSPVYYQRIYNLQEDDFTIGTSGDYPDGWHKQRI